MDELTLERFKLKSQDIIGEAQTFNFPFLSSQEEKRIIIQGKKAYLDRCFCAILPEHTTKAVWPDGIWHTAEEHAVCEFMSLPKPVKLNGFYLQELMREYAIRVSEYLAEWILMKEGEK